MIDQQTKYDKNISLDDVLTLWYNMYGEDMEQEYDSFIVALSKVASGQQLSDKITEAYAQWVLNECNAPVDEIQCLVDTILSDEDEKIKKKHIYESIIEVVNG